VRCRYWNVGGHIQDKSGKQPTVDEILADPDLWLGTERGMKSDRDLLVNSMCAK